VRQLEEVFLKHSLESLKFDYEETQSAIEKVNDFLQTKELQKRVFKIDLFAELDQEEKETLNLRTRRTSSQDKHSLPIYPNKAPKTCQACGTTMAAKNHPG